MARVGIGRWFTRLVLALAAVVIVLIVVMVVLLQTSAVSRRVKDLVVPRASEALGRELTVEGATLRVIPGPRVTLTQVAVAGRPGEPPLVELQALEVSLRFWPLVTSLGKDIEVGSFRLVKPIVNLVRAPDGTWNYQGLGKGGAGARQPGPEPAAGGTQRKIVVSHAAVDDGTIRLIDQSGPRGEATVAISHLELDADHVGLGEPLDARISAALVSPQPNLQARIHADRLPESMAALGPGQYPELSGSLALSGLELSGLRDFLPPSVTGTITGGRVDASARLSTARDSYHVDGEGKLAAVQLRGQPAEGGFDLHATLDPAKGTVHAAIEKIVLKGPGIDLGGNATVDAMPVRIRFAIAGPLLDLGQVLGLLPPSAPKPKGAPVLTAEQRQLVRQLDVAGTIDVARVVKGAFVATELKARTVLDRGAFLFQEAKAQFFGGQVDTSGTRVDLAPAVPTWNLQSRLEAVDLGQALTAFTGAAPVVGKLKGSLALDGAGVEWEKLRQQLTGHGTVALTDGALTTTNLGNEVLGAVATGLRAAGKTSAAGTVSGAEGKTPLRDVSAQFTVKDGAMTLSRPLSFGAPFGSGSLGGKIGLDGALGLSGNVVVPKQVLASSLGPIASSAPASLSVPVSLGGTLSHPSVSVNAQQAVAGLVTGAVKGAVEGQVQQLRNKAQEEAKGAAQKGLGDILKQFGK